MEISLKEKLQLYRISNDEYGEIKDILGHEPEGLEWPLFSALWSEHCSYKSSRVHLSKFYSKNKRVKESFGENAGVIDLGQGERVAFKMESHNHPSFIEPYQGAATGVGGILRDIFTMGARPMALGNYLCFGQPNAERMSVLVDGVVKGIGGYGNCVGVPNITGQTEFHSSYNGNILVNAFALGYFGKEQKVFLSKACGPGNHLVYVGAKTGRDGVHGASMASESFSEDSEAKKPNVQIGDPFFEKCLIESCLEVMQQDLVEAIQDMGAAGLTSSSFEMASKGGVGLNMHLDKVPVRDSEISPEEILLSESQERMLLVCKPENFEKLKDVFHRWMLEATVIGEVKEEKEISLFWNSKELLSIDPDILVENAPKYQRPYNDWVPINRVEKLIQTGHSCADLVNSLEGINGTSREWIYRQYDQRVGASTQLDCASEIGVIRLPESQRGLGVVLGCRPYVMRFDSFIGGADSVYYPALQLAIKGFEPLAVTDCLNFGNPEIPELMTEFVASLEGMNQLCKAIDTPVISGNVSFYNETLGENITSTPSTGVVGLSENPNDVSSSYFSEQNEVFLLQNPMLSISGKISSECKGLGDFNFDKANAFQELLLKIANKKLVVSSRVVGKFGIPYCLARMCLRGTGFTLHEDFKENFSLLGYDLSLERLYEVVFAVSDEKLDLFRQEINSSGFRLLSLGQSGGAELNLADEGSWTVEELRKKYNGGWKKEFNGLA